jgi:hypothetical protein
MSQTDAFDLGALRLSAGQGRRLELETSLEPLEFGGERYEPSPAAVSVQLDIARMTAGGYSLRLRFSADRDHFRLRQGHARRVCVDDNDFVVDLGQSLDRYGFDT